MTLWPILRPPCHFKIYGPSALAEVFALRVQFSCLRYFSMKFWETQNEIAKSWLIWGWIIKVLLFVLCFVYFSEDLQSTDSEDEPDLSKMTEEEKQKYFEEKAKRKAEREKKRKEKYGDKYEEMKEKHEK